MILVTDTLAVLREAAPRALVVWLLILAGVYLVRLVLDVSHGWRGRDHGRPS